MSKRRASCGLSRRRFLQLGACGAGSAMLAEGVLGKPLAAALVRLCPNPESSYLPLLAIEHGSPSGSPFNSPAIRLSVNPDGSGPGQPGGAPVSLYPVVTVENQGTAPVFNAMVNFYSSGFFGAGPDPTDVVRADAAFLATQLVSIPPQSSRIVVSPTKMFFPGPFGFGLDFPILSVVVVECFDPLTDPIRNPGSLFHVGSDRHAAARAFEI